MLNIFASLYMSFRVFGLRRGWRLPIYVYGRLRLCHIGKIRLCCPLRRRLLVLGSNYGFVVAPFTLFDNQGVIELHGPLYLNYGTMLSNRGTIVAEGNNIIGNRTEIRVTQRLELGFNTILGFDCHVMDTDMHYVVDVTSKCVARNSAPIRLGRYNWIGSNCYVKKGTVTPDYLTVASPNTLLLKDYSQLPPYSVLAGTPARAVRTGFQRICNYTIEQRLRTFFAEHPHADSFQLDDGEDLQDAFTLNL